MRRRKFDKGVTCYPGALAVGHAIPGEIIESSQQAFSGWLLGGPLRVAGIQARQRGGLGGELAPHLTGVTREQALAAGLVAATAIVYEGSRARALAMLAPYLTDAAREQVLEAGLASRTHLTSDPAKGQLDC